MTSAPRLVGRVRRTKTEGSLGRRPPARASAHVLQVFQPGLGGVPGYVAALVPGLLAAGVRVSVACPPGTTSERRFRELGVDTLTIDVGRHPQPLRDAVAVRRIVNWCGERRVSIIHGHSTKGGLLAALAGARAGVPSIYTPHGWAFEQLVTPPLRAAYAQYERQLVRRFHAGVITNSASGREAAERWRVAPHGAVKVVPTGLPRDEPVDRDRARRLLGLGADEVVAAWVGRAAIQKRPNDMVTIARALANEVRVVALCAGARSTGLDGDLRDAGVILAASDCDPATVYASADMFVQTSAWEDAPLAVLEAMAAGLPVVAYDVGGVGEQVRPGRTGYLVAPGDTTMLTECISALAAWPERRQRMGSAGRDRVDEAFRYSDMVAQVVDSYAALSAHSNSPLPNAGSL